jgi:hypothetical protein
MISQIIGLMVRCWVAMHLQPGASEVHGWRPS